MRASASVLILTLAAVSAGCAAEDASAPEELVLPVFAVSESKNFNSPLSGDEEVPPVNTDGRGNAVFQLSRDGASLEYRLIVTNLENITQSHIHIAPAGSNGPVVVFLFGQGTPPTSSIPGGVTENGVIAQGTITQANLIARPAIGFGATVPELLDAMRSGRAYVNVHTVPFPGGEIRGQVKENGPTR
jgi:hypothetical protein